jgi:uncharacterized protein YecE (DUF72 family)
MTIRIGTAGWSLRKEVIDNFPGVGTHLQRYARRLDGVEINSSFYRPHRRATYARWRESTPDSFQFSVKIPKQITHEKRLVDCEAELASFLENVTALEKKLGPLLVQLPPSLAWHEVVAARFFAKFRSRYAGPIACEPRHPSWFEERPSHQLADFGVDRVAADPAVVEAAASPGGAQRTGYVRWHGSPRVYYSSYTQETLERLAKTLIDLEQTSANVWCIFDNTAENAAIHNALTLTRLLSVPSRHDRSDS